MSPPSETQPGCTIGNGVQSSETVASAESSLSTSKHQSTLPGLNYPAHRNVFNKSTELWLQDHRDTDGAEGLWRINDTLYDLSSFVDRHPGGKDWIQITKGMDITEAFESHHLSPGPSRMLKKFEIRAAKTPRASPYTFAPEGFYAKIRSRVFAELPEAHMRGPSTRSCLLVDSMVLLMIFLALGAAAKQSFVLAALSGTILGMITVAAHNFFHLREHWRRYYFDLSGLSSRQWRVSHVLSHHLYPNTVADVEISIAEPMFQWLPRPEKGLLDRFLPLLHAPIVYSFIFSVEYLRRVLQQGFKRTDLIPLIVPFAMLLMAPSGQILNTLLILAVFGVSASFYFGLVGFNAAHHHPDIFHDGDAPRADLDWGLQQLDAVRDRTSVSGVVGSVATDKEGRPIVRIESSQSDSFWHFFMSMVNFGHHSLHHLFPPVDHAHLPRLYPILAETLTEFGVPFVTSSFTDLLVGQFKQIMRTQPNTKPPSYLVQPHEE